VAKDDNLEFDDLNLPEEPADLDLPDEPTDLDLPDEPADLESLDEGLGSLEPPAEDLAAAGFPSEEMPDVEGVMPAEEGLPADVAEEGELAAPEVGVEPAEEEEEEAAEEKPRKKGKRKKKKKKPKKVAEDEDTTEAGFVEKILSASPYTVLLAVSLLAMILAVFLLFAELRQYNFDIKARELEDKMGAAPAVQLESPSTMATA
jgi:hypothetical protein